MNGQQKRTTQLHLLIQCGANIEMIRDLINQGVEINGRDEIGSTPLHRAVARADESMVSLLISAGADVNAQDFEYGATPLHIACQKGCDNIAKILLDNGASPNIQDNAGEIAVAYSVVQANDRLFPLLLESGLNLRAKLRHPLIIWAARSGRISTVQLLLAAGCDVNEADYEGWTALHAASLDNSPEMVRFLLENSADVHARSGPFSGTPLFYACSTDEDLLDVVQILINSGSDVNARDNSGRTPYYEARDKGHIAICKLLIEHGAIASTLTIVSAPRLLTIHRQY